MGDCLYVYKLPFEYICVRMICKCVRFVALWTQSVVWPFLICHLELFLYLLLLHTRTLNWIKWNIHVLHFYFALLFSSKFLVLISAFVYYCVQFDFCLNLGQQRLPLFLQLISWSVEKTNEQIIVLFSWYIHFNDLFASVWIVNWNVFIRIYPEFQSIHTIKMQNKSTLY